jgi:hypothetical protein
VQEEIVPNPFLALANVEWWIFLISIPPEILTAWKHLVWHTQFGDNCLLGIADLGVRVRRIRTSLKEKVTPPDKCDKTKRTDGYELGKLFHEAGGS